MKRSNVINRAVRKVRFHFYQRSIIFVFLLAAAAGYAALPIFVGSSGKAEGLSALPSEASPDAADDPAGELERKGADKFIRSSKKIPNKYVVVLEEQAAGPRGENSRAAAIANDLSA